MFDNKLSKVLTFGLSSFCIASILIRLVKIYLMEENTELIPLLNIMGAVFIIWALLFFVLERRSNLPFFYGVSQSGGFIVAAVGLNFFNLDNVQFIIYMIALSCVMLLLAYVVKAKD